jgi:hypothetical protein
MESPDVQQEPVTVSCKSSNEYSHSINVEEFLMLPIQTDMAAL